MLLKKISEFYFYKQLVMGEEMKDVLTAFVDALGDEGEGAVECDGQTQTVAEAGSAWSSVDGDRSVVDAWPTGDAVKDEQTQMDTYWSEPERASDTWADITNVFDNWLCCLIDTEQRICTPGKSLKSDRINQSIDGMLEDGLINFSDASELRFIGNSWLRLSNSYALYKAGCRSYKCDIISLLFDLYASKQIGKELCIQICTGL